MKILLVDDDAFLRDMYATKFGEKEHHVSVAETGERALELIREEDFDAVLLDMVMPGMTGLELLHKIKEEKKDKMPTCIMLTNDGSEVAIEDSKALGAAGYIVKAELIPSDVVSKVEELAS